MRASAAIITAAAVVVDTAVINVANLVFLYGLFIDKMVFHSTNSVAPDPNFSSPIANITVPVGREAVLTCVVHDLFSYKVRYIQSFLIQHTSTDNTVQSIWYTQHSDVG